ncbi:hypothetical protein WH47_06927 [Habropoda laboriosa]|uniref:Uncharacterized protein n=1 Tax=Habropoda laboriosa TaxID=597456 RepID=A0A0L7QQJ1_9HYME|nr:hypothetical protein WH47_06927 [Habropoda laboriosa]
MLVDLRVLPKGMEKSPKKRTPSNKNQIEKVDTNQNSPSSRDPNATFGRGNARAERDKESTRQTEQIERQKQKVQAITQSLHHPSILDDVSELNTNTIVEIRHMYSHNIDELDHLKLRDVRCRLKTISINENVTRRGGIFGRKVTQGESKVRKVRRAKRLKSTSNAQQTKQSRRGILHYYKWKVVGISFLSNSTKASPSGFWRQT